MGGIYTEEKRIHAHNYYLTHRDYYIKRAKVWQEKNLEKAQKFKKKGFKKFLQKVAEEWQINHRFSPKKIEEIVAKIILPQEGFSDILLTRDTVGGNGNFPVDVLAKKDNKRYAIEVTSGWFRCFSNRDIVQRLLKLLDCAYLIYFVRPDGRVYWVSTIPLHSIPSGMFYNNKKYFLYRRENNCD